ncbi:MAG: signal peptidase II [Wolbachia endosymbiont of Menacanthus eurysternus]|nr:MAG: signal peptidase II [Wolbachia endosymbiont of Menacanthus eurysternus]
MKKLCLIIILIIVLTDQMSKLYIGSLINGRESIEVVRFIKLIGVWNTGVSFGMFSTLPHGDILFSTLSMLVISILIYLIYKSSDKLTCFGFSLMLGGAIGNIIDRIYWGAVYDFICFYIGSWYWPTFNLADVYIVCGMFVLLCRWYIYDRFILNSR